MLQTLILIRSNKPKINRICGGFSDKRADYFIVSMIIVYNHDNRSKLIQCYAIMPVGQVEMEDNQSVPARLPPPSTAPEMPRKTSRGPLIIAVVVAVVVLALLVAGLVLLLGADLNTTGRIRDIFIIFMALEFLIIGVALIVLMIQLATLINLLQNEVRPILTSTTETVNTLRGTAVFLSENLVQPVIKMNEYMAGLKKLLDLLHLVR